MPFRDEKTQLILASVAAVIVLIAAVIALPGSKDDADTLVGSTATDSPALIDPKTGKKVDLDGDGTPDTVPGGAGPRGSGSVAVPPGAPEAPPITATSVKVGISYVEDPGTANEAAGFGAIGQVDQKRGWDAMIKEINKNPPAGRKIVPVFNGVTTEEITSKGDERLQQEACAFFTQDNPVFMVWEWTVSGEIFDACLTKNGIPSIASGAGDSSVFKKNPYKVAPTAVAMDRLAAFQVDQLFDAGFYKGFKVNSLPYTPGKPADGKPRIGLIRYDQPEYKVSAAALKARLKAHSLALCAGCEFEISYSSDNPAEQLDDATEINAAIQNFKAKGVTHVTFLGTTAGLRIPLFFIDGAEKQQYRPRLGFNPNDSPTVVRDFLKDASYPQLRQSVLITDSPAEFGVKTDAFKLCKKIWEDAGETFEGDQASNKEAQIAYYCDPAWYYRAAMESVGRALKVDTWMDAVHTMKPVPSAAVFLMQTKVGRHDGSGAIRIGGWSDACHCFKPTSGVIPV